VSKHKAFLMKRYAAIIKIDLKPSGATRLSQRLHQRFRATVRKGLLIAQSRPARLFL
jgi:hypothetical protein